MKKHLYISHWLPNLYIFSSEFVTFDLYLSLALKGHQLLVAKCLDCRGNPLEVSLQPLHQPLIVGLRLKFNPILTVLCCQGQSLHIQFL